MLEKTIPKMFEKMKRDLGEVVEHISDPYSQKAMEFVSWIKKNMRMIKRDYSKRLINDLADVILIRIIEHRDSL